MPPITHPEQLFYLAAPFTSPDPAICQARVHLASQTAVTLCEAGYPIFSPLSQGAYYSQVGAPDTHEFWDFVNFPVLRRSSGFFLLPLPGWEYSAGILREIAEWINHCTLPSFVEFVLPTNSQAQLANADTWISLPTIPDVQWNRIADHPDFVLFSASADDIFIYMLKCQELCNVNSTE